MRGLFPWLAELFFGPESARLRRREDRAFRKRVANRLNDPFKQGCKCATHGCYGKTDSRCDGGNCTTHCKEKCNCVERYAFVPNATPNLDLSFLDSHNEGD